MKQVKNKNSLSSKQKIFLAAKRLIQQKNTLPTITEITKETHVSRSYFYKLFNTPEQFFSEMVEQVVFYNERFNGTINLSFNEAISRFFTFFYNKKSNIKLLNDENLKKIRDGFLWVTNWIQSKLISEYPFLNETEITFIVSGIIGIYLKTSVSNSDLNLEEVRKTIKLLLNNLLDNLNKQTDTLIK